MQKLTPDRTSEGWTAVASAYEQVVTPFTSQYAADALRLSGVTRGARVLDVACGPGTLALAAAKLGADVTATDFAPDMVDRLRERIRKENLPNIRAEVMDGQALRLPDGTFDYVFSVFGLIFFPDRAKGFREMHRVLRPGGTATVVGWSRAEKVRFFSVLQKAVKEGAPDAPPPAEPPAILSLADPARFAAEMKEAGFQDVKVHTVTHDWVIPSAEQFWENQARISPVFKMLLDRIGRDREPAVRDILVSDLRREFGSGPVRLSGEAHIGVGQKGPR